MPVARKTVKTKTATPKKTVKSPKKGQKQAISKSKVPPLPPNIKCSFCRKSKDTARRLIAGPPPDNAFICDECLFVCVKILAEENPKETYKDLLWLMSSLAQKKGKTPMKGVKKPNTNNKTKGKKIG